ncbi:MAG TPA: serpin family protein [Chthonomonadales bacterium]|nr:serpin family protein [Chthonomonadales bacterium]
MNRIRVAASLCVALGWLASAGCGSGNGAAQADRGARSADLKVEPKLVTAMNDFGFRLHRQLLAADPTGNVFLSPTSIQLALGMAFNGARAETRTAMAAALGYGDLTTEQVNEANKGLLELLANPDPKVDLYIANAVWARSGMTFDPGFLQRTRDSFLAQQETVDFSQPEAAQRINAWVSDRTAKRIPEIVTADAIRDAILVLTNAVYFKAGWTDAFQVAATSPAEFAQASGKPATVPMMRRSGQFSYAETDQYQAVRLPYAGRQVGMVVVLPRPGVKLADVAGALNGAKWRELRSGMAMRPGEVRLPRFKARTSASLKTSLSALGMGIAFDPGRADLNGVLPEGATTERVYISDALHRTVLTVDEQGTEAAAATAVIVGITSAPAGEPFRMVVDRPFLLAIEDEPTGVILFVGSIGQPE